MKSMWTTLPLAAATAAALLAPTTARAGCDGTVSATALGLAASEDDRLKIALESFGIDSSLTELFRPALQTSLASSDAAAMTNQLRGLCHAFGGGAHDTAPLAVVAAAAQANPPPAPAQQRIDRKVEEIECASFRINPSGKKAMQARCAPVGSSTEDAGNSGADEDKEPAARSQAVASIENREWLRPPVESREEIERVVNDVHDKYLEIRRAAEADPKLKSEATRAELALMQVERDARLVLPGYGLFVGPTFLLEPGGGFKEAFELSARYDSGRFTYPAYDSTNWIPDGWVRGFLDLNYRSTDTTDDESNDQTPDPNGYFGRDDGRVRVDLGAQWHFLNKRADALGAVAGVGFTAPLADNDQDPTNDYQRGAARWFVGLHSLTNYRVGVGELMLGYANDRYWDVRCPAATPPAVQPAYCGDFRSRYFAEGLFTLAKEDASDWSVIGRLSADIPTDSDGQADVAISVLLRRDLDAFLTGFKKD